MRRYRRVAGLLVVVAMVVSGCTGSSEAGPGSTDVLGSSETTESEAATTTGVEFEVLPEFDTPRSTLIIPDSDSFSDQIAEVTERYYLYTEALIYAAGPPQADPDYELLQGLVTGERAVEVRGLLEQFRDSNSIMTLPDPSTFKQRVRFTQSVVVEAKEGAKVFLVDCNIDTTEIQNRATGEVTDGQVKTYSLTIEMTYTDGEWRVSRLGRLETYEGESTCPDQPE